MANAVSPVTMPTGVPLAAPVYLVINDGSVVSSTNGIPVNVVAGTISAENPSVGVLAAAIPADATLLGASDGTNLQQLLVESNTNRNLRIGIYNGANEITTNSTTYTAKFGLDANLLGTLGTAFTTAGFVDIKGADGNVFVRQTTAANLNATATIQAVTGTSIAIGSNALPILNSAATGYVSVYASNPAALTSSTDYSFKWGASGTTQVNHVMIQNNSGATCNWDLDVAATLGSPTLTNGQTVFLDVQTTTVHLFQAATPNVNGSSAGNIVVRGWL